MTNKYLLNPDDILQTNYFNLFDLPLRFDIDTAQLKQRYIQLQKQLHPDTFNNTQQPQPKISAMILNRTSAHINHAYATLSSPLPRAKLLLELCSDIKIDLTHETQLPIAFLHKQMEVHEAIIDATNTLNIPLLEELEHELNLDQQVITQQISQAFKNVDYLQIKELIKQLSFYEKLKQLIDNNIHHLL